MAEELTSGDRLGDFEIVEVAGAGGMGVVYKARQLSLDRDVALKVIKDEIAAEAEYRERFLREAKLAASVDHPHVVTVYDVGEEDGRLYLVMQWIDGSDLRQVLDSSGRLTPKRAIVIGEQLARALDAVHEASGLVHRDVKPANVLLRDVGGDDHAYLTDFGVAKPPEALEALTRTGSTVGTTGYLAPEQIRGKDAGPRSDLYSLGCLTFEMLTGKQPFTGENDLAVRWAHARDPRPLVSNVLPALGHRYDGFFVKALAIDPDQRFASGREFAEGLAAAQSGDTDPTAVMGATHAATAVGPATPPPSHTGQQQTPPPYGYVAPPPQSQHRDRSGSPAALIVIGIVTVCGIAAAVLAASGVFSKEGSPTSSTVAQMSPTKTTPKASEAKFVKRHQPKKAKPPAGSESCSGASELWVNRYTSCPFAENTQSAYAEANGAKDIYVYSPVTGKTYSMTCKGSGLIACVGGNNAVVYFGSAKASGQNTAEPAPRVEATAEPETEFSGGGAATIACDSNIYVNQVTSCPFAENVFEAYADEYQSYGESGYYYVEAYSEDSGKSFGMDCYDDSDFVECTGGTNALVTFPMQAVRVY
jgi:serine/threonine protein kinase